MNNKKVLPPTYLLISIVIMVLIHFLLPLGRFIPLPWNLFGLIPIALGIIINSNADKLFRQASTTIKPYEKSTALVTDGVYQISRNPMYLGMVLVLAGVTIMLGSLIPIAIILVFVGLITTQFIRVEERMLEEQFGQQWLNYKAEVRRWI